MAAEKQGAVPARAALGVFARPPERGRVKGRLARTLGADEALRTHLALTEGALARLQGLAGVRVSLWASERPGHPAMRRWSARWGLPVRCQCPGDLGRRMDHALRQLLLDADCALVVGTDIPLLNAAYVMEAVQALAAADLVFGPVEDGGYGLVGLRVPQPGLFQDIPWGTGEVLDASLAVAERLRLRTVLLDTLWDVDDVEGWRRYRALGHALTAKI